MEYLPVLTEAIQNFQNKPTATKVVEALLTAEKTNKHQQYNFTQLLGTWRLYFITGTKKTREKAGVILGEGQYVPRLTQIYLSYTQSSTETGYVSNCVTLGTFKLTLTGPIKFFPRKNILAFDFTRINLKAFNSNLYSGYLKAGKSKEEEFYQEKLAKQAFFSYFLVTETLIAARGKEGGLALWGKQENLSESITPNLPS